MNMPEIRTRNLLTNEPGYWEMPGPPFFSFLQPVEKFISVLVESLHGGYRVGCNGFPIRTSWSVPVGDLLDIAQYNRFLIKEASK